MEWWRRALPLADLAALSRRRIRLGGLAAAIVTIGLLVAAQGGPRQALFDVYQRVLPAPAPGSRVAIVAIDEKSFKAFGGWPWSRYYMARLTEEIGRRGASAIGFDFPFPEPDRQAPATFLSLYPELAPAAASAVRTLPTLDAAFSRAISRYPVVLARVGMAAPDAGAAEGAPAALPPARFRGPTPPTLPSFPTLLGNIPELDGAAAGYGLLNARREGGGVERSAPMVARVAGQLTPGLPLELVRVAENVDAIDLEGDAAGLTAVRVGRHRTPVSADGELWLRLAGRDSFEAYPAVSAADLLQGRVAADVFRGKVVLVGLTATGTSDVFATPRDPAIYGVLIHAQLVDAILSGRGLARPGWAAPVEWTAGLVLTLFAWLGVPRAPLRLTLAIAGAASLAAFGASALAFQAQQLIDPLPVLLPGAATAVLMVVLLFVEGRRIEAQLRDDLVAERLGAARLAGEMSAASDIQAGMLLPRAQLARITPAVEIDAVLQPARQIGGDFYDVFMIDPGRLCFLIGDVTGKGPPASLFMALSKAHARSFLMRPGIGLGEAVCGINAELLRDNRSNTLVTLLVGILDLRDGRLELCRAGHDNPIVVGADGVARELEQAGFLPLCGFEDTPYASGVHQLQPGEILVAYTDGLTEATTRGGSLYGHRRALGAVEDAAKAASLVQMVDAVIADVRAFEAGQEATDDLAVLALRRRS